MDQELNYGIMPGEIWRNYKGGNYKIITLANHTETKEPMIVYQSLSFGSIYARPLSIWCEAVENRRGGIEPRFVKIQIQE